MKLFSKVNEYNIMLEKILENKYFSSNVKNLLLSMIYKIENSYEDYYVVKRLRKSKEEFLKEIFNTIKDNVNIIKIAEPNTDEAKILEKHKTLAITNEKNGTILAYPTENALLYALSDIKPKYYYIKNEFIFKNGFHKMLLQGQNKNNLEILTDFNGWSWDFENKEYNYIYNIIFQNLTVILGNQFLDNWRDNKSSSIDFLENFKEKVKNTKYFYWLCRIIFLIENNNSTFQEKFNLKIEELNKIRTKDKYLENLRKNKLKLTKAVEKIDKILNDNELLIKKFNLENMKLDDKKKMKNIKTYKLSLEKDRNNFIKKLKEISWLMIPQNYIKYKEELEEYEKIKKEETSLEETLILLEKEYIKIFKGRISLVDTNDSLIDILYQFRYYKNLLLNKTEKIIDNKILNLDLKSLEKKLITSSCKNAIIRIFSMDINLNYEIINNILNTKIIELEQIKVKINFEKNNLIVEVYDKETFEKSFTLQYSGKKQDVEIRKNRSVSLFL